MKNVRIQGFRILDELFAQEQKLKKPVLLPTTQFLGQGIRYLFLIRKRLKKFESRLTTKSCFSRQSSGIEMGFHR